ncbi:MAG: hypothetical protein Q9173_007064 [Seirophora scorigena]
MVKDSVFLFFPPAVLLLPIKSIPRSSGTGRNHPEWLNANLTVQSDCMGWESSLAKR